MVKVFSLLLVFFAVLAIFGRLRIPMRGPRRKDAARCRTCGKPRIGNGPCSCGDKA